jgi:hypothetical protein
MTLEDLEKRLSEATDGDTRRRTRLATWRGNMEFDEAKDVVREMFDRHAWRLSAREAEALNVVLTAVLGSLGVRSPKTTSCGSAPTQPGCSES